MPTLPQNATTPSNQTEPDSDDEAVPVDQNPALNIVKTATPGQVADVAGESITYGITVENTPLRKVGLPAGLSASIEQKLSAEQESQRMEFVLMKERQEADRKRIEAQGVADFQKIVSAGISEQLLKWKGIEATMEIARSQNAKVVVIGAGKDGLPLILGGQ